MEYYHGLVRVHSEKLTQCSRRNSQFRLLHFSFIHVLAPQRKNQLSIYKHRGFFEQKIMFDRLYYVFFGEICYF